ncbi:leucine--tRNA ligase [archaeon]|nr:leucine--tRNA ligase [archaeon]
MNLQKIEQKWQSKWRQNKVFQPGTGKGKKFFFTVPYPYTSGPLHVGHGRTYCVADFVARFKRKMGYNVLWPMAFHISGTPILAISERIKNKDKKYTKLFHDYVSLYESNKKKVDKIIKSFTKPQNVADYFASVISNDFNSIGLSIDWRMKFNTGEPIYNKFIEWQYEKLMKKKAITKGDHPVTYCVNCENAVGEDDIKDGDTDKVKINEFTAIKFKLDDEYLIGSSLRPETIYGITNLWVNPDETYIKAEYKDETLIMSAEAYDKAEYQLKGIKKISEFVGKELIGKHVDTPIGTNVAVLPGEFVDPDTASGIVYSVPAHAPLDYIGLKDLQGSEQKIKKYGLKAKEVKSIKPVTIIDIEGYDKAPAIKACKELGVKRLADKDLIEQATKKVYKDEYYKGVLNDKCGEFSGLRIKEIKDQVINKLKKDDKALTFYETTRKAECRCGGKVIIAVLNNQWFIDYTSKKWKKDAHGLLTSMRIYPEKYRKQFLDVLDWLEKRPCARRRGLGTHFPFDKQWMIESLSDSTIYMSFYTIAHLIRKHKVKPKQLTPELFDYVYLGKGGVKSLAKKTKVPVNVLKKMRESFTYWYPNDQRHTAPGHIGNHLIFFIMHHVLIFPKKHWPKAMTFNEFLTGREGVKMSKSRGNVIPLIDIPRKYSADLYRLYVTSSTEIDTQADWREKEVASVKNKLKSFYNLCMAASKAKPKKKLDYIDKWIVSRFYSRLKDAKKQGEEMEVRAYAVNIFFKFLNEVNYYRNRVSVKDYNSVLRTIIPKWIIALEPIIPHLCEEINEELGSKEFVSLKKYPKIKKSMIKPGIENYEKIIINLISDINEVVELVKKEPRKITLFISHDWKYELIKKVVKSKNKRDFKKLIKEVMKVKTVKEHGKEATRIIKSLVKDVSRIPKTIIEKSRELETIVQTKDYLEKEFGAKMEVIDAENSKEKKAGQAMPGKPGILIT